MSKRYIVGITCGSENGVQVAPYFVVGIDHDQALRILEQRVNHHSPRRQ